MNRIRTSEKSWIIDTEQRYIYFYEARASFYDSNIFHAFGKNLLVKLWCVDNRLQTRVSDNRLFNPIPVIYSTLFSTVTVLRHLPKSFSFKYFNIIQSCL